MKNPIDTLIDKIEAALIKRGRDKETAIIEAASLVFTVFVMLVIIAGSFYIHWVHTLTFN